MVPHQTEKRRAVELRNRPNEKERVYAELDATRRRNRDLRIEIAKLHDAGDHKVHMALRAEVDAYRKALSFIIFKAANEGLDIDGAVGIAERALALKNIRPARKRRIERLREKESK